MQIILSPVASTRTTKVSVDGLCLTIDGVEHDLSVIPENGQAESDDGVFVGVVTRQRVVILYHYDASIAEPHQPANVSAYTFEIDSGDVPCPIRWKIDQETEGA